MLKVKKRHIVSFLSCFIHGSYKYWIYFLECLFASLNQKLPAFLVFGFFPKNTDDLPLSVFESNYSDIAIIIQGPLKKEDNYTLLTVKFYKRIFPSSVIIVSTWEDEDKDIIDCLRLIGVSVLLNQKPKSTGYLNSNLQIVSTAAGLREAASQGRKFILKTRADQRMYSPIFLDTMRSMLMSFPVSADVVNQKYRILGVDINTFYFRPFSFSDVLQFGHIEDLWDYWGAIEDNRNISRNDHLLNYKKGLTIRDFVHLEYPEVFLMKNFLNKKGDSIEVTYFNYFNALRRRFLIIDASMLGLHWGKYTEQNNIRVFDNENVKNQLLGFSDWINIYNGSLFKNDIEDILDIKL